MKKIRRAVAVLIASAMLMTAAVSCEKEVTAENLMEGISAQNASEVDLDDDFCQKYSTFAFRLLQKAYDEQENVIISPLAITYNLALLGNGASGSNLDELKGMLGSTYNIDQLSVHMHSYKERLLDSDLTKLYFESAAWFNANQNVTPNAAFLQTNATYFGNAMYKESFNADAIGNVNNWISNQTQQNVEYIADELPADDPMYLLSTVMLDGNWSKPYSYQNVQEGTFNAASGEEQSAQMMSAYEQSYIHDDMSSGFVKQFSGGNYAFVAILPGEAVGVKNYIASVAVGDKYMKMMNGEMPYFVDATVPKFTCEQRGGMAEYLSQMNLGTSFNPNTANLSQLGTADGKLYAGDLYVRSSFTVTEKGTSKGTAATVADDNSIPTDMFVITLDRPFLFMVIDTNYKLPIMMGVINHM